MNQGQDIIFIRKEEASLLIEMSVLSNNLHQKFQENIVMINNNNNDNKATARTIITVIISGGPTEISP